MTVAWFHRGLTCCSKGNGMMLGVRLENRLDVETAGRRDNEVIKVLSAYQGCFVWVLLFVFFKYG